MESLVLHNSRKSVLVSHDRGGCRISVNTTLLPSEVKRMLYSVADEGSNIYVPSEISQEVNCYSFYIRQRQSVRDYLLQNECTVEDYIDLVRSVFDIVGLCSRLDICVYDFIFDYSCIYTGASLKTAEYVYAPGGNAGKEYNSIANMLTLASLHIQCEDNSKEAISLKEATRLLIEWENDISNPFPLDKIIAVLDLEQKKDKILFTTWKPFLYFQGFMLAAFILILLLIPFKESGVFVWIAWILLMVSVGYILLPGKKLSKPRIESEKFIELRGYDFLKGKVPFYHSESINIGRDPEWADLEIDHLFASRHHAVISYIDGRLCIKDLNSRNGTYIDGKRIISNEDIPLRKGSIISFGHEKNKVKVIKY